LIAIRRLMKLQRQHNKCAHGWLLRRCQCSASVSWHAPSAPAATNLCPSARARLAPARSPRDAARFPAHCLEGACRLVTLESGVLAVDAKGRLAPLVALTDFNFPRFFFFSRPPAIVAQCHIRGERTTPELSGVASSPTAEWGSSGRMSPKKAAGQRTTRRAWCEIGRATRGATGKAI